MLKPLSMVSVIGLLLTISKPAEAQLLTKNFICHDKKVIMLSSPNCEECQKAKIWLRENKILLDEIDQDSDKGKEVVTIVVGKSTVPISPPTFLFFQKGEISSSHFSVGFNMEELRKKFCV